MKLFFLLEQNTLVALVFGFVERPFQLCLPFFLETASRAGVNRYHFFLNRKHLQ